MAIRYPSHQETNNPIASMPHPRLDGQPDPDAERVILGVDTDKDVHVAALITTP
jgi:hypothetical protein